MTGPPRAGVAPKPAPAQIHGIEGEVARLIEYVGDDPERDGLRGTPGRVARWLLAMTRGYEESPAAILEDASEESYGEAVTVRGIEFWSLCERDLVPFRGRATVSYLPDGRLAGPGAIARLVECYARRLQAQERMTDQVAQALEEHLEARGVAVHIGADHPCEAMRTSQSAATTHTYALRGDFRNRERRREFLRGESA